jgi:hypothetical protein
MQPDIAEDKPIPPSRAYNLLVRHNPAIRTGLTSAVVVALVAATLVSHRPDSAAAASVAGMAGAAAPSTTLPVATATAAATPTPSATPSAAAATSAPPAAPAAVQTTAAPAGFASTVAAVVASEPGHGAVAVTDLSTGAEASFSDNGHLFDTGSIVKVDILATLLYQHQQAGTAMTASEKSYATTMIENSNNDSANALFNDEGDVSGLTAANRVFGLTGTTINDHWGDTTTDPTEQIKLLRQVFTSDSVLTAASRAYIVGLMSQVESDQRWGISAAASPGTSYLVKNGWLPSSATGLWTINSIGEVTYDGHLLLIAVQTDGNSDMGTGVAFAQKIAATAAQSLVANE